MTTTPTLEVKDVMVSIAGSRILRGVDLQVPEHSLVCLMGRNGVGKTTTLRSIVGLQKLASGAILLNGKDVSHLPPEERARSGIAFVPQGREIFPNLTVRENLEIGKIAMNRRNQSQVDRVFTLFPVLKEMLGRKGGVLSGGQQQQLAIGRALLTEPQLLILDEPTEGIQPSIIDQIGDALRMLKDEGSMSILLVEQYLDFCQSLADHFFLMDRGSIAAAGTIADLSEELVKAHLTV